MRTSQCNVCSRQDVVVEDLRSDEEGGRAMKDADMLGREVCALLACVAHQRAAGVPDRSEDEIRTEEEYEELP